jgi:hypothetical protein
MAVTHFAVGEHVRLRISTPFVRAGRVGAIGRAFVFVPDLYDVQFDGLIGPRLIYGRELEHAAVVPESAISRIS